MCVPRPTCFSSFYPDSSAVTVLSPELGHRKDPTPVATLERTSRPGGDQSVGVTPECGVGQQGVGRNPEGKCAQAHAHAHTHMHTWQRVVRDRGAVGKTLAVGACLVN